MGSTRNTCISRLGRSLLSVIVGIHLLTAGCGGNGADAPPDGGSDVCPATAVVQAVQAADRKILGAGAAYAADQTLRGRDEALAASQRLRREAAWTIVAKVLGPVDLAYPFPSAPGVAASLPRWQTWYARDDLSRLFERLYAGLGAAGRAARAHFAEGVMDDAFAWNVTSVDELPSWPAERWQAYLAAVDSPEKAAGVGGIARVGYSPAAARHLMNGYPELVKCLATGAPPRFVDGPAGPGGSTRRMAREPLSLEGCTVRVYGPYFVAGGETLRAVAADAAIDVRAAGAAGDVRCHAGAGGGCDAHGPGAFEVVVSAGAHGASGMLEVDYTAPDVPWAACLRAPFPSDAVVVKADWRRVLPDMPLAVYDTSAAGLAKRLSAEGAFAWGDGDGKADPGPQDIYTATLANGNTYRLAALHIMTKELDHWVWITLWWSPDDTKNADFGADRPAAVAGLGGPWAHYKMCTTTAFEERDASKDGGYAAEAPTLAAALRVVHSPVSWCSNPYLEVGAGNADTNCLGCHQHAGTKILAEDIIADPVLFPVHGRVEVRNNFPSDYSWSVDHGDELARMFADVVAYWDPAP